MLVAQCSTSRCPNAITPRDDRTRQRIDVPANSHGAPTARHSPAYDHHGMAIAHQDIAYLPLGSRANVITRREQAHQARRLKPLRDVAGVAEVPAHVDGVLGRPGGNAADAS